MEVFPNLPNNKYPQEITNDLFCLSSKEFKSNPHLHRSLTKMKNSTNKTNTISQNSSFLNDFSHNFSVNEENVACNNNLDTMYNTTLLDEIKKPVKDEYLSIIESETNENLLENFSNMILVYKLEDNFLIPMEVIQEDENKNTITLRHIQKQGKEESTNDYFNPLVFNKNEVFIQRLSPECLIGIDNLTNMKIVNELSILKNIETRFNLQKEFLIIDNIFLLFSNDLNRMEIQSELSDWLKTKLNNENENELILLKAEDFNSSNKNFKQSHEELIINILRSNNYNTYLRQEKSIRNLFSLLEMINLDMFLLFSVANFSHETNHMDNDYFDIQYLTIFPSSIDLFNNSFILSNPNSKNKNVTENKQLLKRIKYILNWINFDLYPNVYKEFINEIAEEMLLFHYDNIKGNNLYLIFLERIINILISFGLEEEFTMILNLTLLAYIFSNFKYVFNLNKIKKNKILSNFYDEMLRNVNVNLSNLNSKLFTSYANIVIVFITEFLIQIVRIKISDTNGKYNLKKSVLNIGAINYNREKDSIVMEEMIYNLITNSQTINNSEENDYLKFIASKNEKFLKSFSKEFLKKENSSDNELEFLNLIKIFESLLFKIEDSNINSVFPLSFILNNLNLITSKSFFKVASIIKNRNIKNLKQIQLYNIESCFKSTFLKEENVIKLFQENKLIDYIKLYSKNDTFYAEYTIVSFFKEFLPILIDIDTKYSSHINYTEKLTNYLQDVQKFSDFKEKFEIDLYQIKLNYKTYSILNRILKSIKDEKALLIQKIIRGKIIYDFIRCLRTKVRTIQIAWRNYLKNKTLKLNIDESFDFLLNKLKKENPSALGLIFKIKKDFTKLENSNFELIKELSTTVRENQNLKSSYSTFINSNSYCVNVLNPGHEENVSFRNSIMSGGEKFTKYPSKGDLILIYNKKRKTYLSKNLEKVKIIDEKFK